MRYLFEVIFQEKKAVVSNIFEVSLAFAKGEFIFKPGQYIWLINPSADKKNIKRQLFFIASVPGKISFSILVQTNEQETENFLLQMHHGDKLQIAGPFGSSLVEGSQQEMVQNVFITHKAGIAPFLSILRSNQNFKNGSKLLITVSEENETICYQQELEQMEQEQKILLKKLTKNFNYDSIGLNAQQIEQANFYINGEQNFTNEVTNILQSKGIPVNKIFYGDFYPKLTTNLLPETVGKFVQEKNNLGFLAIQQSNHHIIITDANGTILFVNQAAQDITGFSNEEMLGNNPRLWGGLMDKSFYKNFWDRLKSGKPFIGQMTNRRKNGQPYHTISNIAPIKDASGNVIGFIDTEEDITQRIFFEENLRLKNITIAQEQQRVNALLESLGEGVVATDLNGMIINANPTAQTMLGFTQNELLGKNYTSTVKATDDIGNIIPIENRTISQALSQGIKVQNIYTYVRKDGSTFVAGIISTPIIVEGNLIGVITVFRDVTKEKEIDRAKTEFISLASHQLRTPLSAVKWFLGMILAGDTGKITSEQQEMINNVYKSNERMIQLVNSLLNVSRIESGRIIVEPVPTDIKELLDGINKDLTVKIKEKNQTLAILVDNNLPKINVDPLLIRQVYLNLLTNALKYSPPTTQVTVSIAQKDNDLISFVKDQGYGIPQKDKDKVFTKLYRGENILTKVTDGNGLGLYLVKQIIESSKGKIWFESEENKGTTFFFTLPLSGMQEKKGEVKLDA